MIIDYNAVNESLKISSIPYLIKLSTYNNENSIKVTIKILICGVYLLLFNDKPPKSAEIYLFLSH